MLKAVVFDMDGTLIDSEKLGHRAWLLAARQLGCPDKITSELVLSFVGRTRAAAMQVLEERLGSHQAAEEALALCTEIRGELYQTDLAAKPGAREALEALRGRGIHCALATSTYREAAEASLDLSGLGGLLDSITTGDEVEHGKPAPDIFLLAARRAGAEPEECAVVEDSRNGVLAGHAAGMFTVLVPDIIQPDAEMLAAADVTIPSLEGLLGVLPM